MPTILTLCLVKIEETALIYVKLFMGATCNYWRWQHCCEAADVIVAMTYKSQSPNKDS